MTVIPLPREGRQYLLSPERQLTVDGREEPLLDTTVDFVQGEVVDASTGEVLIGKTPVDPRQRELNLYPSYVRACMDSRWHFTLQGPDGVPFRAPFRCGSWRCPQCRRKVAARDYARITESLWDRPLNELVFMVVTLDQTRDAALGINRVTAYRALTHRLKVLMQSIRREFGKVEYVCTIEQHRSGWPHANFILHAPGLASALAQESVASDGLAPEWLREMSQRAGLGWRVTAEHPRGSQEALAGYIVKVAHHDSLKVTGGEVVKLSQLPVTAPKGTRRLRPSRGFLPKRKKREGYTGRLVKVPWASVLGAAGKPLPVPLGPAVAAQGAPEGGEATAQPAPEAGAAAVPGGGGGLVTTRTSASNGERRLSRWDNRKVAPAPTTGRKLRPIGLFSKSGASRPANRWRRLWLGES